MFKRSIAILIICFAVYWSFDALLPSKISTIDAPETSFSSQRALIQLKEIAEKPHFLGNQAHQQVREYIVQELEKLGLETQIQVDYSLSKWGNLSKPKNIIARIKGNDTSKALLLLSHYDSNPHSSFGASDAGSGVVTILEGIRAFLAENKTPKNDIIILISDGEELGLNGADIFVNKHPWAKEVGLVLNFEARGSGGPSYMLIETNQGNANLMKEFVKANPEFPVANSLAYSIYKMLPNDTDLTRFRTDKDIDGFNFAFIDDHFDYHTALDTYARLDRNTLEHQGSYIMPLLHHFSNANLNNIKSTEDYIYFTVPAFKTIIYPFTWIWPMLILAILSFIGLLIYGFKKKSLNATATLKGFIPFFTSLVVSALFTYFAWQGIKLLYPQYQEMLHGFTYNGHAYIAAFTCLALAICFYSYHIFNNDEKPVNLLIAPLFFWLLICVLVALELQGASFFIIPVYFGLISLFLMIRQQKPSVILLALLGIPLVFILAPLVKMFPVGLGLKIVFVSAIFVVLIFGLLISVFGFLKHKKRWAYCFVFLGTIFLIKAHFNSKFTAETPKPNSLLYVLDANENTAVWATYDDVLDAWTESFLTDNPDQATELSKNTIASKYKSSFTFTKKAAVKDIAKPKIEITHDTIIGNQRQLAICVTSLRNAVRYEVFSDSTTVFNSFVINGISAIPEEASETVFKERLNNRLFSYYVSDKEPLDMIFTIPAKQKTQLQIYEATYDLLNNKALNIPQREASMMPKPFVLNDAIVTKNTIIIE
ncbi:M28 family peptidase [Lacinutrix sp. C3R15]|uniref:M28 family peptidase n=1 Tax=Flavobacteriaceae TaxID=49546 RepID=UPI001C086B1A|nr:MULTISPECIES: M28 family peptidase [Flavobacteriaceae]MBU2938227.1 M28 family peptidase [Lacinutrix sp. C3R15]MDO6621541.1 M28 family peptidase [Oceanihabitans sp. 1_MG-2023]